MATGSLTFAQRNAASELPAVAALADGELVYTPGPPQFSSLVASILGNAGTSSDGFDSIFNAIAAIVDGDIAALGAVDVFLTGIEFLPGALDGVMFSPIAGLMAVTRTAGDGLLKGMDDTVAGNGSGGGGGGGGGGGSGSSSGSTDCHNCLCKRRFPYGFVPGSGSLDDPCAP